MLRVEKTRRKITFRVIVGAGLVAITLWGVGALNFSPLLSNAWRRYGSSACALLTLLAFLILPRRGRTALGAPAVFATLVILFLRISASNNHDWQPEVADVSYATINGEVVTIHNVRNFTYRTETNFDARWKNRTYDLSEFDSADIVAVYWAGKAIAHAGAIHRRPFDLPMVLDSQSS